VNLPNAENGRIDPEKVTEYLLCLSHPVGAAKAEFFAQFGFALDHWKVLADSLLRHGQIHQVSNVVESEYGTRYSVDGELQSPDGRNPMVRTVWIIERGELAPRLITAHPIAKAHDKGT